VRGVQLVGREACFALLFYGGRVQGSHCEVVVLHNEAVVFESLKRLPQALFVGAGHFLAQMGDRLEQAETQKTLLWVDIHQVVTC
jgi:hypothetical protein